MYWEITGTGDPVLLIHGLGLSGGAWWRTVDTLAPTMSVITFDHRGIGRSKSMMHAYTTEAMADDAVSILDALDIERVHVYGFSLGGMIAQQIALRHPDARAGTRPRRDPSGGRHVTLPDKDVLAFFQRRAQMPSEVGGLGIGSLQLWAARPHRAA